MALDRYAGLMCVLAPPTTHPTHNRINIWTYNLDLTSYTWITELHHKISDCLLLKNLRKWNSFLLIENSTSLIVVSKINDWIIPAHTDCVPSWTAKIVVNSGINYFNQMNIVVWSCRSSLTCKIWSSCIFVRDLTRLVKKSLQVDKEKTQPQLVLSNFKIILPFKFVSSSNPMDYRETQRQFEPTIISANFSTMIFWVWLNHPVPTFNIWPSISHPYPLPISYYSSFS